MQLQFHGVHFIIQCYMIILSPKQIGSKVGYVGEIKEVKILGVIALIDKGETDWKVISIDINDPMAESLNDIG